jgi:hypothetical protein
MQLIRKHTESLELYIEYHFCVSWSAHSRIRSSHYSHLFNVFKD